MKPNLFIVNPKSGTKNKDTLIKAIPEVFSEHEFDISETKFAGHACKIARNAVLEGRKVVVAIGGDGTINETASGLAHSDTALAMIPTGSGNGFARHFHISMDSVTALKQIKNGTSHLIDTLVLNDRFLLNVGGIGFDARIAHAFAELGTRGFISYAKVILRNFGSYSLKTYQLNFPEGIRTEKAFLISFANASQYGNQAEIAPSNLVDDGFFETCILKPFRWYAVPSLLIRTFTGHIRNSRYYESIKCERLDVELPGQTEIHVDGEPFHTGTHLKIRIQPQSLKIIVPS